MKRQQLVMVLIIIVAFLSVIGLNLSNAASNTAGAAKAVSPSEGVKASDFTLTDLNGQKIKLSDVIKTNQVTLVNFWATWCPPCCEEIPELISFYSKYGAKKVSLLGIDLEEEPADVKAFAKKNKMNYPVLFDSDGKVSDLYKIYYIPTTFFVDNNGKIRDKIEGGTDFETLEGKVQEILKGE
jgi:peroxiredoxin